MSNTNIEGELFPFEEMPQQETNTTAGDAATTPDGEKSLVEELKELREQCAAAGIYIPQPADASLLRGEAYFHNTAPQVHKHLTDSGVTQPTIDAVLTDYAHVLMGYYTPVATLRQMHEVLSHVKRYDVFITDRYALYWGLCMCSYARNLQVWRKYKTEVIDSATATDETRREFVRSFYSAYDCRAISYLANMDAITPADFVGVEPEQINEFTKRVHTNAVMSDYAQYVFVAKYTLSATPEELADITPPPIGFTNQAALNLALAAAGNIVKNINNDGAKLTEVFKAERDKVEQVAEEVKRDVGTWSAKGGAVALCETLSIINSRAILVVPDGDRRLGTLPVEKAIKEFVRENGDKYGNITVYNVYQAVEAINRLSRSEFIKVDAMGRRRIYTTKNEFATAAGYVSPNAGQQNALLGALRALSDLPLLVVRPFKTLKKQTKRGVIKVRAGGPTVARIVSVEYETENRNLIIEIKPDVFMGGQILIQEQQYQQMIKSAIGGHPQYKIRFNNQILTKSHKSAEDITAEIYDYQGKYDAAQTSEEFKKIKRAISKKHAERKRQIAQWFKEYEELGIIGPKDRNKPIYNEQMDSYTWKLIDGRRLQDSPAEPKKKQ